MGADDSRRRDLNRFRAPGVGMEPRFRCMGCDQNRSGTGSRGTGIIRRRCAQCVQKKGAR